MNIKICEAINTKKLIHLYYDGGYRLVEPYCHGVSRRLNEVVRGYQISGYSESGKTEGWKLFKIAEVDNISIEGVSFTGDRPDYEPNDSVMTQIHCKI